MPSSLVERLWKRTAPDPSQWLLRTYRAARSLRSLPPILVGVFTVGYFAATCELASLKPFRFDELYTYTARPHADSNGRLESLAGIG